MKSPNHVKELKEGVDSWNEWRKENPSVKPSLKAEKLDNMSLAYKACDLQSFNEVLSHNTPCAPLVVDDVNGIMKTIGIDFHNTDLRDVILSGATLWGADFRGANCTDAKFQDAELQGARFQGADLSGALFCGAKVSGVKFDNKMKCRGIDITGCTGSQRFVRHVMDLDYIEEFKEDHPNWHFWWELTSDCGRSWGRWACCTLGLVLFFAALLYSCYFLTFLPDFMIPMMKPNISQFEAGWFAPIYFSIVTFTTLGFGDITPSNTAGQIFLTLEVIAGYIMLGGLISLISNKMGRRS